MKICSLVLLFFSFLSYAQLINYIPIGGECEVPIYIDSNQNKYSTILYAQWNQNIFDVPQYSSFIDYTSLRNTEAREFLLSLEAKYGSMIVEKLNPAFLWGDTLWTHKRSNQTVTIPDLSQSFRIQFVMHHTDHSKIP